MILFDYLVIVLALFLIGLVMLQKSNDDIQGAFSGEKSDLFKNTKEFGFEKAITIATTITAVLLVVFVVLSNTNERSIF